MRTYSKIMKFKIPVGDMSPEDAKKTLADLMKEYDKNTIEGNPVIKFPKNIMTGGHNGPPPDIEAMPVDYETDKIALDYFYSKFKEDAEEEPTKVKTFFQKLMFWKK